MNKIISFTLIAILLLVPLFVISATKDDAKDILFSIIENAHLMSEEQLDVVVPMAQDIVIAYLSNESFATASAKPGPITGMTVDEIVNNATITINNTISFFCNEYGGFINSSSGPYWDCCIDSNHIKEYYCGAVSVLSTTQNYSNCTYGACA